MKKEKTTIDCGFKIPVSNNKLSDIKYGEPTKFLFFGNVITRNYKTRHCDCCGKQITAYYVKNKRHQCGFHLVTNQTFNHLKFCHRQKCADLKRIMGSENRKIKVKLSKHDYLFDKFLGLTGNNQKPQNHYQHQ